MLLPFTTHWFTRKKSFLTSFTAVALTALVVSLIYYHHTLTIITASGERAGLRALILPADNEGDYREIPAYIRKGLKTNFAVTFDDVAPRLFGRAGGAPASVSASATGSRVPATTGVCMRSAAMVPSREGIFQKKIVRSGIIQGRFRLSEEKSPG